MIAGQDVAIVSQVPGTTTDVVEKPMELLPLGPVVFLDTAGMDDRSELAELRIKKSRKVFDRSDVVVLLLEPQAWSAYEEEILAQATAKKTPVIIVVNKIDRGQPTGKFLAMLREKTPRVLRCSSTDAAAGTGMSRS